MRIGYDAKRIFHNSTGLGNYGRDVVRILTEYARDWNLVLFNPKRSGRYPRILELPLRVAYPKGWFWNLVPSLWRLWGISRQIRKEELDAYHGLSGELPLGINRLKIRKSVTVHDVIFLSHPHFYSRTDRWIYTLKVKYAVRIADRILAISEQTKKDLVNYLGVDPEKIEVVYQGCNDIYKVKQSVAQIEAVKEKYGLKGEYLLNVGTIQERKNALTLLKAIKDTPYNLVLVGSPKSYERKVRDYIAANNMEQQVHILSNTGKEDLAALYQGASIFCYPSLCEGFGIPIIEALFSGTPVIASAGGCFPEAAGPSAVYVPATDPEAFREAITDWMESPEKRKKAASEGLDYVQRFTDENVAANLKQFYKHLMS